MVVVVLMIVVVVNRGRLRQPDDAQQQRRHQIERAGVVEKVVVVDAVEPPRDDRGRGAEDETRRGKQAQGGRCRPFAHDVHRRCRQYGLVAVQEQSQQGQQDRHHRQVRAEGRHKQRHHGQEQHSGNQHDFAVQPVGQVTHHRAGEDAHQHQQAHQGPANKQVLKAAMLGERAAQAQFVHQVKGQDGDEPNVGHATEAGHYGDAPDAGIAYQQLGLGDLRLHGADGPLFHRGLGTLPDVAEGPEYQEGQEDRHGGIDGDDGLPRQHGEQGSGQDRADHVADVAAHAVQRQHGAAPVGEVGRQRGHGRQVPDRRGDCHHRHADDQQGVTDRIERRGGRR